MRMRAAAAIDTAATITPESIAIPRFAPLPEYCPFHPGLSRLTCSFGVSAVYTRWHLRLR
jgi:hypothetical protein